MTEGLTLTAKKFMKFFQPLSSETIVSSVSPLLYRYATPHNATGHGREEGEILKLISLVQKKCLRGKALEVVSEELEEDPENIREIYKAASEHLENSPEDILEILKRG